MFTIVIPVNILIEKRLNLGFKVFYISKTSSNNSLFTEINFSNLNNIESKGTYIPAKYDGVDLIPGKVEIEK